VDVATPVLPLSLAKLFLAASWWEHEQEIPSRPRERRLDPHEMLVSGSDSAGRQLAVRLRHAVGTGAVFADLERFGFRRCLGARPGATEEGFWGVLAPQWRRRLLPAAACVSLPPEAGDERWASAFSIGEAGLSMTLLHVSRFLQAVGNGGILAPPTARSSAAPVTPSSERQPRRGQIMRPSTARRLQAAMIAAVAHGSAAGIQAKLGGGWQIGGKTGTGPGDVRPWDGCFAGLVFDDRTAARYTLVSYVQRGGRGAGAAAHLAADLVKFTLGR
jgi:cell division protein FtsI/penicillin-binding protein 2